MELFDNEVARLRHDIEEHPDFQEMRILEPLDNELVRFTPKRPDHALSALAVPALMRLYDADGTAVMAEHMEPFLNEHEAKLRAIYEHYEDDTRANPLLFGLKHYWSSNASNTTSTGFGQHGRRMYSRSSSWTISQPYGAQTSLIPRAARAVRGVLLSTRVRRACNAVEKRDDLARRAASGVEAAAKLAT